MIGVKADGSKELLACADGYRESTESWADVLRGLKKRGMGAPMVAVGDGALGFWAALADVFPDTREQRCWVHKTANILDALPKRLHRSAKAAIHEIYESETRSDAETQIDEFVTDYGDKYPKAVAKLANDRDVLLTFYDFPRRPLDPSADHQPDRVDFCDGEGPNQGDERCRDEETWPGDGLQAARRRPRTMAESQQPRTGRSGPCRHRIQRRKPS